MDTRPDGAGLTALPTGTVTFLFTDVEGSSGLLDRLGEGFGHTLERHEAILRDAIEARGGIVFGSEGDALFAVFRSAGDAVEAAVAAQRELAAEPWPPGGEVRVRMGLHTGSGVLGGQNYLGIDVHRVARICAAGHGGQVVVSAPTRSAATGDDIAWLDLGEHRLKGIERPERLYQLRAPGLAADFPTLRTVSTRPLDLPPEPTAFFGRDQELDRIAELARGARVVTLTGPGGSGKTRLAVQAARRLLERFEHGVAFVDLGSITDARSVLSACAGALGVTATTETDLREHLTTRLPSLELLLVVDNAEHVLDAAPDLAWLVATGPRLQLLVTSRRPLRVAGEREIPVEPLPVPADRGPVEDVLANPAVALFVDRAVAIRPGFALTASNARAVGSIVARLDGLPLALELGAGWLRVLSPEAILGRLDERRPLTATGRRDAPERQRTMDDMVAWSHDLLSVPEQRLLRRLGVFAGPVTLETIERVCRPSEELELDALDGLAALVEANLVRVLDTEPTGPRFTMLETVRDVAARRLAADVADAPRLMERHLDWQLELAERNRVELGGSGLDGALLRIDGEYADLRAALRRCIERGHAEHGVRLASAVWRYWRIRGRLAEGRRSVESLLGLPGCQGPTATRCDALLTLGSLTYWQLDVAATQAAYGEALAIARGLGDQAREAQAAGDVAFGWMLAREPEAAHRCLLEAIELRRRVDDRRGLAEALLAIGSVEATADPRRARARFAEAGEIFDLAGDRYWSLQSTIGTAVVERLAGEPTAARALLADALDHIRATDDVSSLAQTLNQLATLDVLGGHPDRALALAGAVERLVEEDGAGVAPPALSRVVDPRSVLETVMDPGAIEAAWRAGRALPREAVFRMAVESATDRRAQD